MAATAEAAAVAVLVGSVDSGTERGGFPPCWILSVLFILFAYSYKSPGTKFLSLKIESSALQLFFSKGLKESILRLEMI